MSRNVEFVRSIPGSYALSVCRTDMPTPKGWEWVRLQDVARLESGHTPSRRHPEYWDGDIRWIGIKDARLHHGATIMDTFQTVTQAGIDNSAARLLPKGTVCLSRTASIGYVCVMGREMATSQDFVNWVCSPALEPAFLAKLLIAEGDGLLRFGKGSTHTTIYFPEVENFWVCLPAPGVQRRIVAKLDALLVRTRAAKAALDRVPGMLERLRQSILAAAFRGELEFGTKGGAKVTLEELLALRQVGWQSGHPGLRRRSTYEPPCSVDEPVEPLPKGWCWATLEACTDAVRTIRYGILMPGPDVPGGIPYVKVKNLKGDHIDLASLHRTTPEMHEKFRSAELGDGDLLVTIRGTWGRVAEVPPELVGGNVTQDTARVAPLQLVNRRYLAWALRGPHTQSFLNRHAKGMAVKGVNIEDLRRVPIPLPPLDVQGQIATYLDDAFARIASRWAGVASLAEKVPTLERALLAAAFRGELVAQAPSDEPASVLLERFRAEGKAADLVKGRRVRKTKVA